MTPNLPKPFRIAYVVIGIVLLAVPLLSSLDAWIRIGAPIVGLMAVVTGATGW